MKRKISSQFMANYFLMFIISAMLTLGAFLMLSFAGSVLNLSLKKNNYTASGLMQNRYTDVDFSPVVENGGGAQIIDNQGNIVLSKGIDTFQKDRLSVAELTDFFAKSQSVGLPFSYSIAYNESEKFWLIITFPTSVRIDAAIAHNTQYPSKDTEGVTAALAAVALFYLLILTVVTVVYSKLSSISIIKPLRELSDSVRLFRDGQYSTRVDLKQKNEFLEIQNAFNEMAQRIEVETSLRERSESNRKKLIADISHDLKTPLANIMGYADLLISDQKLSEEQRGGFIKTIYSNGVKAGNLISDMFELSKIDSPEFKLNMRQTDVCEFMREQIAEMLPQLDKAGYTCSLELPRREVYADIDEAHLRRVFQNLLSNTIRHTPVGTHVDITLCVDAGSIKIIYRDNGGGIPQEIEDSLFDPFVRADASRHSEGTGLGLAIVKKIITAHGGDIHIKNVAGIECTFVITLGKV